MQGLKHAARRDRLARAVITAGNITGAGNIDQVDHRDKPKRVALLAVKPAPPSRQSSSN